jgi:hypothetical protein
VKSEPSGRLLNVPAIGADPVLLVTVKTAPMGSGSLLTSVKLKWPPPLIAMPAMLLHACFFYLFCRKGRPIRSPSGALRVDILARKFFNHCLLQ